MDWAARPRGLSSTDSARSMLRGSAPRRYLRSVLVVDELWAQIRSSARCENPRPPARPPPTPSPARTRRVMGSRGCQRRGHAQGPVDDRRQPNLRSKATASVGLMFTAERQSSSSTDILGCRRSCRACLAAVAYPISYSVVMPSPGEVAGRGGRRHHACPTQISIRASRATASSGCVVCRHARLGSAGARTPPHHVDLVHEVVGLRQRLGGNGRHLGVARRAG